MLGKVQGERAEILSALCPLWIKSGQVRSGPIRFGEAFSVEDSIPRRGSRPCRAFRDCYL